MKKILIALWLIFIQQTLTWAQFEAGLCGTAPPTASTWQFLESLDYEQLQTEDFTTINIPVTIHIVRPTGSTGGGFSESNAFATICDLNQRMTPSGMFFFVPNAVNFINDDDLLSTTDYGDLFNMISTFNVPRTVNVYYTNLGQLALCGFAFYPGTGPGGFQNDGAVVMSFACSQPNGTTLAHEIGHYFNLPHTFDQTAGQVTSFFAERVTRNFSETFPRLSANCNTAGDRFCDTPADFIGTRWSCPTGQIVVDINGDRFRPDSSYYMSYSNDNCMSRFSNQQNLAMRATLANTSATRGYLLIGGMPTYPPIVNTPNQISPATNDSVIPNQAEFRWNSVPGADFYQIRIILPPGLISLDTITSDTVYVQTARGIRANRPHQWEVRAINGANLCTPYSSRIEFNALMFATSTGTVDPLQQLKVYPNLVKAGDLIQIGGYDEAIPLELRVFDQAGRLAAFEKLTEAGSWQIPASLQSGMYLLSVQQNSTEKRIRLIVR